MLVTGLGVLAFLFLVFIAFIAVKDRAEFLDIEEKRIETRGLLRKGEITEKEATARFDELMARNDSLLKRRLYR